MPRRRNKQQVVNVRCHANEELLAYLGDAGHLARSSSVAAHIESCSPDQVDDPYMKLGTHPDLVERVWRDLGGSLSIPCQWVVFGTPVLAHPRTGVVFALAGGTVYALRLPRQEFTEAVESGAERVHNFPAYPVLGVSASTWDLRTLGPGWIFGRWDRRENDWCLAAHQAAEKGGAEWLESAWPRE